MLLCTEDHAAEWRAQFVSAAEDPAANQRRWLADHGALSATALADTLRRQATEREAAEVELAPLAAALDHYAAHPEATRRTLAELEQAW